jgi:uncharacterized protein (TIGR03000 family)
MYSIVLATMLTTGSAAPDLFGHGCCGGCHGCCGGCWGCCGGCWGCCGGCWGCYGCCGGCWGCCGGCYGYGFGYWGVGVYGSCYGCWGTCFGCHGCYGCYGCYGACYGGVAAVAAVPATVVEPGAAPAQPQQQLPPPKDKEKKDTSYLGNAAAVVLKAPAGVQLSIDGRAISRTAAEETFRTPELEPGYSYTYTFQARVVREGKTVSYTKQVKVRAGQVSTADFTKLAVEGRDTAQVTVKLPADARLYVDDVLCPLKSTTRSFDTPELKAGQKYYYVLKAEVVRDGEKIERRKHVVVEAGKQVTVEFKDLPLQTVSR